jgi:hypothetical protein
MLPWFPYAGVIRFRFSGYDLSLLLQAPPTLGDLVEFKDKSLASFLQNKLTPLRNLIIYISLH